MKYAWLQYLSWNHSIYNHFICSRTTVNWQLSGLPGGSTCHGTIRQENYTLRLAITHNFFIGQTSRRGKLIPLVLLRNNQQTKIKILYISRLFEFFLPVNYCIHVPAIHRKWFGSADFDNRYRYLSISVHKQVIRTIFEAHLNII